MLRCAATGRLTQMRSAPIRCGRCSCRWRTQERAAGGAVAAALAHCSQRVAPEKSDGSLRRPLRPPRGEAGRAGVLRVAGSWSRTTQCGVLAGALFPCACGTQGSWARPLPCRCRPVAVAGGRGGGPAVRPPRAVRPATTGPAVAAGCWRRGGRPAVTPTAGRRRVGGRKTSPLLPRSGAIQQTLTMFLHQRAYCGAAGKTSRREFSVWRREEKIAVVTMDGGLAVGEQELSSDIPPASC